MFISAQTVDNGERIVYNKAIRYLTLSFREDSAGKVLPNEKQPRDTWFFRSCLNAGATEFFYCLTETEGASWQTGLR